MTGDLFIGLMSGTSLDGVDAALVVFDKAGHPTTLGTHYVPYPDDLRLEALALHTPGHDELHRTALLSQRLSHLYANACNALLRTHAIPADKVAAIGCHGQTVRHRPESGYSLQISNPSLLAELTGIAVITDFRSRDIAAGGQGAPLVPAVHEVLFRHATEHRALLNLGGIANLTNIPPAHSELAVTGFDCGPANMLLDAWIQEKRQQPYDRNGDWAASGKVLPRLLERLSDHEFFASPPPKSCGRESFNLTWLNSLLTGSEKEEDVQATLLELTAWTCAQALEHWCQGASAVFVCGGGASNQPLMERLQQHLPGRRLETTDSLGIPPDWLEAVAFAWLAHRHLAGLPGNLPAATGAAGPRILGALYPA